MYGKQFVLLLLLLPLFALAFSLPPSAAEKPSLLSSYIVLRSVTVLLLYLDCCAHGVRNSLSTVGSALSEFGGT